MKDRNNTNASDARLRNDDLQPGQRLSAEQGETKRQAAPGDMDGYAKLTGRERWIVSELIRHKGAPNKVIAYELRISPNTLRNHLASIYGKLGVRRRVELVVYALEQGLVALPQSDERRSASSGR